MTSIVIACAINGPVPCQNDPAVPTTGVPGV